MYEAAVNIPCRLCGRHYAVTVCSSGDAAAGTALCSGVESRYREHCQEHSDRAG